MDSKKAHLIIVLLMVSISIIGQNSVTIAKRGGSALNLAKIVQEGLYGNQLCDSTLWLNYSALVNPSEPGSSISAEIATGEIPEGMRVYLEAKPLKGGGLNNSGSPTGKVQLSYVPKVIIENIGTGFTGSGVYVGHQIIVSYEIYDFSKIEPGINSIYLQFTLK